MMTIVFKMPHSSNATKSASYGPYLSVQCDGVNLSVIVPGDELRQTIGVLIGEQGSGLWKTPKGLFHRVSFELSKPIDTETPLLMDPNPGLRLEGEFLHPIDEVPYIFRFEVDTSQMLKECARRTVEHGAGYPRENRFLRDSIRMICKGVKP